MTHAKPKPSMHDDEREMPDQVGRPGRRSAARSAERTSAEFALLGLIAGSPDRALHGYDLARVFAESALGRIIRLESGMLYHYLKKLARDGYISTRVERQVGRPDRQVHALTPLGEEAMHAWITAPVRSTREIRLDFLIKLYLARQIDPRQAETLVRDQQAIMAKRVGNLERQLNDPQPATEDHQFGESVLRLRLGQTESALAWLSTLPESSS